MRYRCRHSHGGTAHLYGQFISRRYSAASASLLNITHRPNPQASTGVVSRDQPLEITDNACSSSGRL
jgi:hypothetical protein